MRILNIEKSGGSEKNLQESSRQLLGYLADIGFVLAYYHTFDSRRSQAGYPDWTIVLAPWRHRGMTRRKRKLIWVELKSARGRLSKAQEIWAEVLAPDYYVIRSFAEFAGLMIALGAPIKLA